MQVGSSKCAVALFVLQTTGIWLKLSVFFHAFLPISTHSVQFPESVVVFLLVKVYIF